MIITEFMGQSKHRKQNGTGKRTRESRRKRAVRKIGLVLFLIYLAALIYFLFFADWYDHAPGSHWEYRYNLVPFKEIRRFLKAGSSLSFRAVFLNLAGNVIGFLPFGFFLPVISGSFRNIFRVTLLGFAMSCCVEAVQLITKTGVCDVDDVILNTCGAFLGYVIFLIVNERRKRLQRRRMKKRKTDGR